MARNPKKKQKENPVGCTGEDKRSKVNKRGSEKIRREPPVVGFGGEVTLVRLADKTMFCQ